MKRNPMIVVFIFLLCLTVVPVSALEAGVTVQSAEAAVGEIVYLPLSLEETQEANTVGIGLTFDRSALEFVASQSTWSISGTIRNFDRQREYALWSDSKTQSLNGELCRLAFRVKEGARPSQCSVTCSVVLKIDAQEVASYAATGEITLQCQHSYGEWTKLNANAHARICQFCGSEEYGTHAWDQGTVTKEPTQMQTGMRVFVCQLCGAEQEEGIPALGSSEETVPPTTLPGQSEPNWPQTTLPTQQGGQGDYSNSGIITTDPTQMNSGIITTDPTQMNSGIITTDPTQNESTWPQTSQSTQSGNQGNDSGGDVLTQPGDSDGSGQGLEPLVVPEEDVVVIRPDDVTEESAETPETAGEGQPTAETEGETQSAAETKKHAWIGAATIVCLLAAAGGTGFWFVKKQKK